MLPSDHFVRMYNELFKMLGERSEEDLEQYWLAISGLQETIIGPGFRKRGFQGMYDYWERIRIEENCDMELAITADYFEIKMKVCPSLSKNMDNDAGLYHRYCDHCAGWINPVIRGAGFYPVYDIISRTEPRCHFRVYKDRQKARHFAATAELLWDPYHDLS
jgi:hypothetical protein